VYDQIKLLVESMVKFRKEERVSIIVARDLFLKLLATMKVKN
jgi:hypothetical protein